MASIRKIGNDTEIDHILNRDFTSFCRSGYIEVGEENVCLPVYYEEYQDILKSFEVRDDDVFLCAHPKTGTTWAQEMIWLILNNLDYETAAKQPIYLRSAQLEWLICFDVAKLSEKLKMEMSVSQVLSDLNQMSSPRFIKSHLHWSLLPEQICNGTKQPKIISILRNPKDTCVSHYYYSQTAEGYKGTFEDFCELFLAGRVCFGPFWKQVLSIWNQRHRPNILFIRYEDMKNDLPTVIKTVADFLGKTFTDDQIAKLTKHLSLESMKNNPSVNRKETYKSAKALGLVNVDNDFIRSGKVGGYKSEMSPELIARFEEWEKENLQGTGLVL